MTLQNLSSSEKDNLQKRDEEYFFTCPYRAANNRISRESLRNQYGKKFIEKNDGKLPSLNQIKTGVILTNLILLQQKSDKQEDKIQIEKAYDVFESAFSIVFEMANLGDLD